jgi:hypothetical protein
MITMPKSTATANISFSKILFFTGMLALIVQTVIVSYNAITGYIRVEGLAEFLFRVIYATGISTILGLMIVFPDLYVISWLNGRFGWNRTPFKRVVIQVGMTIIISCIIAIAGTVVVNLIHQYTDDLAGVVIINVLISTVINILLMAILEAWLFFHDSRIARIKAEKLQNELAIIRFEVLKNQINPHFLFNSLNVLSGLIDQDTRKAQEFIDAFARIYHYVLETIEKPVVTLEEELGFARSYMYLQQIRHGDHVKFSVNLPASCLPMLLPPLSLQVVLENALKHNITGASNPLTVMLAADTGCLEIRNNLRPKTSMVTSTGIGQVNLAKRYAMIGDRIPEFRIENEQYLVKLPLFPCED